MSETTAILPETLPIAATQAHRGFASYARMLKITLATLVGLLGTVAAFNEGAYITTSDAVVSASSLDVRTPVEGTVTGLPQNLGQSIQTGQTVGLISNPLVDHEHLDTLRLNQQSAQSIADALVAENEALSAQRRALFLRSAQHTAAVSARLEHEVEQATHTLSARKAAFAEAETELRRGQELFAGGLIPRSALEKLAATDRVLAEEVAAGLAALQAAQSAFDAAHHGVLAEAGGNNDVTYSMQRADELAMRLAANSGSLASALAQARQAKQAIDTASARDGQLASSPVLAPSSGTVWKLGAANGEHVAAGALVFTVVDCDRQFVVAAIPQSSLNSLTPNSPATVKFTGESTERTGVVTTAWADSIHETDAKLAATPILPPGNRLATVFIRLDRSTADSRKAEPCQVGRTAQVRIPRAATNLWSRWLSRH